MRRVPVGRYVWPLWLSAAAALVGCDGLFPGGGTDGSPPGRPVTDACFATGPGGGAAPTGEPIFPGDGALIATGSVDFLFTGADPDGDELAITVFVSDQSNVFETFPIAELACSSAAPDQEGLAISVPQAGTFFWGIEVSDGLTTIRRPADGVGIRFTTTTEPFERTPLQNAMLLCPLAARPARAATKFVWSLGETVPERTQVFVGRANQTGPFDAPLRVFEVAPPTATSLQLSVADALPLGDPLTWGLRVETAGGAQFTLGGSAEVVFTPQANVPPSGQLLAPSDGARLADDIESFVLAWDADPGNCEDELTSTVFLARPETLATPEGLFDSPIQVAAGAGALEVNLVAAVDSGSLEAGVWAWGVLASDGTDQVALTDADDATRTFRTFVRDTSPRFVVPPSIGETDCGAGPVDALSASFTDDNGLETVAVTVYYAETEDQVFADPSATTGADAPGGELTLSLMETEGAGCAEAAFGVGYYGVDLNDGANAPVRAVVFYAGPPTGACCLAAGGCSEGIEASCIDGAYQGDGTTCDLAGCPASGACCLSDGTCSDGVQADCAGAYQGDGTACATVDCTPPPPPPPVCGTADCNDNGVGDLCEGGCNANGVPDECEVPASGGCEIGLCVENCAIDCNENCVPDECDEDCNGTGIPDDCDEIPFTGLGDFDSDEDVDLDDYVDFSACMAGPDMTPTCTFLCLRVFDFNKDGDIDVGDFAGFQRVFDGG